MDAPTDPPSLTERLKRSTAALHREAEGSGVMSALLEQRIDAGAYRRLLLNLHAIYTALEGALRQHRADPVVGFCDGFGLQRADTLQADLAHLFPDAAAEAPGLAPAGRAYVERLHRLGVEEPVRLVAHAYVRYLGDLHGGQVLGRLVRQRFDLAGDDGTRFYAFGDAAQVQARRRAFRQALAALPVTPAQSDAIVDEAVDAFGRHVQLFSELAPAG